MPKEGSYNYVVKGKMILGFALVAYPAEYGNSGVMTFMVNQEGIHLPKESRQGYEAESRGDEGFRSRQDLAKSQGDLAAARQITGFSLNKSSAVYMGASQLS